MRGDLLERLMRIAAKTGERHVLVDASLPEPLVVLPWTAYERLAAGQQAPASIPAPGVPVRRIEPEEPPLPLAPVDAPETTEDALNEEEKFYLEPID